MNRDEITQGGIGWMEFQEARAAFARRLARQSEIYLLEAMWAEPAAHDERPGSGGTPAGKSEP